MTCTERPLNGGYRSSRPRHRPRQKRRPLVAPPQRAVGRGGVTAGVGGRVPSPRNGTPVGRSSIRRRVHHCCLGDLGGVKEFIMMYFSFMLFPLSEQNFYVNAIKKLYIARTGDKTMFPKSCGFGYEFKTGQEDLNAGQFQ